MSIPSGKDPSIYEPGSEYFQDQLKYELFKLRIRNEAKAQFDADPVETAVPTGVLAGSPLPATEPELIPGIILAHGATGIVGEKETGKSLVALEMQASLLTGKPLWGAIPPTRKLEQTSHIIGEHTSVTLQELYHVTGLPQDLNLKIFGPEHLESHKILVSNGILQRRSVEFYKRIVEGSGMVVFDPIASFIQGQAAENDNAPMRALINAFIEIARATGAACLVLGHQAKPTIGKGGAVIKRQTYATRGASATEDALTAVHYLSRIPGRKLGGRDLFELKPIHYKGKKQQAFQLVRDDNTCRHSLLAEALRIT